MRLQLKDLFFEKSNNKITIDTLTFELSERKNELDSQKNKVSQLEEALVKLKREN